MVLVATDLTTEDSEVNLDIARQFAREKNLRLVECDVEEGASVEDTFEVIVAKIMDVWDGGSGSVAGE